MFRQIEGDRGRRSSTATPTGPSAWPRGKTVGAANQPEWVVVRPDGRRHLHRRQQVAADARRLAAGLGLRADEAHGEVDGEDGAEATSPPIRLELLNDADLPLGGPGPLDQGDGRADGVHGGRRARRRAREDRASSRSSRPRPTSICPRRRSTRTSTTRAARSESPGRSALPSTARTRPPGATTSAPAVRNLPRKAVFSLETPIRHDEGHDPHLLPPAEPRRLEQRRQPELQPRPRSGSP